MDRAVEPAPGIQLCPVFEQRFHCFQQQRMRLGLHGTNVSSLCWSSLAVTVNRRTYTRDEHDAKPHRNATMLCTYCNIQNRRQVNADLQSATRQPQRPPAGPIALVASHVPSQPASHSTARGKGRRRRLPPLAAIRSNAFTVRHTTDEMGGGGGHSLNNLGQTIVTLWPLEGARRRHAHGRTQLGLARQTR